MEKKRILIIDDEKDVATMTKLLLEELGYYEVRIETDSLNALFAVSSFKPDLILLDLVMPNASGLEICKKLKGQEKFASIPVIILSGKAEESHKVAGLDSGADDYIVKPFSLNELDSRIKAVLRRSCDCIQQEKEIKIKDIISLDIDRHRVTVKGKEVELTSTEFTILKTLASRQGFVFSRSKILDFLWGSPDSVTERTIDVHINHLREKLGESGDLIKNVRGIGYKIE